MLILASSISAQQHIGINYIQVSQDFVLALKEGNEVDEYIKILSSTTRKDIKAQIQTDRQKIAFWVNVYNAFIQHTLSTDPTLYQDRRKFFKKPRINIAGELLSFEDIEHGIIRRSQWPYGFGYFSSFFPAKWEKELRVKQVDWRIHFALNCGAKSCPQVAIYDPYMLDEQLDFMTNQVLSSTTYYNQMREEAKVIALFSWFRGDFGGTSGIKDILVKYRITPHRPKHIDYLEYDWTLALANYIDMSL